MREKVDKTEKILSEFFCSCLRKIHPFQWGKTPKTSNSIVVTSFIYFPISEKKACEGPYGVITGDSLCCALSRGLSWGAHTVQEHSHLSHEVLAPRGAHLSFLTQPPQGKTHWNSLCGMLPSPKKWLSPTSSFPSPVLPTCSHISLRVASQCSRLGKWPVLKLPFHQQKQIAIFNLPSLFQGRESEVFVQP